MKLGEHSYGNSLLFLLNTEMVFNIPKENMM